MRQKGRFAGFSLYISNTPKKEDGRLCYQNKLPLPPLKFNNTCIEYGRYVIYYNERLDGVTYPEGYQYQIYTQLCEVEVRGCTNAGVYGSNCNLPCPDNCQEKRCNIVNGTCLGCIPGWTGDMCNKKCPWGWYGLACKNKCAGHCIGNQPCNHVTGRCEGGCADGWMGKLCDKPCKDGFYSPDCIHSCSGHCLNNTYCSRETGHCDNGCSPGYTGKFCNKPCTPGFFGNNCYRQCSENCKNNRCDHTDGTCIEGCLDGFVGRMCYNNEENVVKLETESTNASTIGGVLGAFVVILVLVLLAVLFMRFKKRALVEFFEKSKKETDLPMELKEGKSSTIAFGDLKDEHNESIRNRTSVLRETAKKGPPTNKTIPVRNLMAIIVKMSAAENAGFKHEYHEIPKGELYPCEEAKKPENKAKNRYTSTFPYDHSRVVLKKTHEGDYINANYIEASILMLQST
ncbi:multiple epidermal growth factor-like domains protein 10 [Saccostrea cucullata]|uniref:multiple epidermal growth factor-like domains protein 10 n=1 Tax=Saccostrea cuccullata TaxID=36930 RepID=UPI002ED0A38E